MKRVTERTEGTADLTALITIVSQAYTASYRDSSLKVRRRYRRLITALEKAHAKQRMTEL